MAQMKFTSGEFWCTDLFIILVQGSNLTFDNNSQMAGTWSRFSSHKCVSTSLGMCTAQNSHFYLINNSNIRKLKTAVAIKCNKLYNILNMHCTWSCLNYNSLFH